MSIFWILIGIILFVISVSLILRLFFKIPLKEIISDWIAQPGFRTYSKQMIRRFIPIEKFSLITYLFLLFLFFIQPLTLLAADMEQILINSNSKQELSKENIEFLMGTPQNQVLKAIREIYGKVDCKESKNVLSQHAIAYIGLFGGQKDASIIKNVWECENLLAKELLPCEYYCAYTFALDLHDVRFKHKEISLLDASSDWPIFNNKSGLLKVDSINGILTRLTEDELIDSLKNKKIRPELPANIIEGMDDLQVESFYRFSVYYQLAKVAKKENTRNELFKELLYLYFRDASGDGGVNNLQQTILLIEKRRK